MYWLLSATGYGAEYLHLRSWVPSRHSMMINAPGVERTRTRSGLHAEGDSAQFESPGPGRKPRQHQYPEVMDKRTA
jgi:hypothetical protein